MTVTSVRIVRFLVAGAAAALLVSCGGSDTGGTGTTSPVITKAATASGDGQTAQVGAALPNPLRVLVTLNGTPQAGVTVSWAAAGAGASVSPLTSVTDANGIATTIWTLGTTAGAQTATATVAGATGSPVSFTATASALPVPVIQKTPSTSGDAQTGVVAAALPNPLRVLVTLSGTPQAGVTVSWAAAGAGASVSPLTSVTDASGIATTTWTLGNTAGAGTATATLAGATGSPVTFSATGTPGAATQLSMVSGDNQSALTNASFGNPLVVKVADQFGNGVAGTTVNWASLRAVANVASATSVSGADGTTQVSITAGAAAGADTITATSTGLAGSPVRFAATVAQVASTAAVSVGDNFFRSAGNNTQNPAVDTIAVGGTVTWTWVGVGNHSVESTGATSFTSSTIKASGTYAFTFTVAGTYDYDCAVHGATMTGRVVVR